VVVVVLFVMGARLFGIFFTEMTSDIELYLDPISVRDVGQGHRSEFKVTGENGLSLAKSESEIGRNPKLTVITTAVVIST